MTDIGDELRRYGAALGGMIDDDRRNIRSTSAPHAGPRLYGRYAAIALVACSVGVGIMVARSHEVPGANSKPSSPAASEPPNSDSSISNSSVADVTTASDPTSLATEPPSGPLLCGVSPCTRAAFRDLAVAAITSKDGLGRGSKAMCEIPPNQRIGTSFACIGMVAGSTEELSFTATIASADRVLVSQDAP
ncbi:MAG: hypothetical protein JWR83_2975 [Aeromicrobium sp.]|nr:hypothetical protein [Aeromicrobium sp.]